MEKNTKKQFGLIGYPLGHSMSSLIHNELFKLSNINAEYNLIEIPTDELKNEFEKKLKKLNGFNVTIPHKINIIPFLDELSDKAKLFGSVNTVNITENKIIGYNTDCIGFTKSMQDANINLDGNVLICGCGGVSRMFAFECILAGANVTLAIRPSGLEKALKIKKEIQDKLLKDCQIVLYPEINCGYDLIINGTPVGMYPNIDGCPVDEKIIKKSKAVFDAVYNPVETKFIYYARKYGLKYLGGLPMLVLQAVSAEEIWNNVKYSKEDIDRIIELVREELENE